MPSPVNDAGKVIIAEDKIKLKKFSGGGELNIYPQVRSFDIYEDLDNFTVAADFYIVDGIELINKFPLGGEELITVTLQTPSKGAITYDFMIDSIQHMKNNDMGNMRAYMLRCVTKDFLKNASMSYTKRYKDRPYDVALSEVLNSDMGAEVSLETLELTKGKFDYVINNKRPFQVIDLIRERAVSGEGNLSSVFVFYQDNKGYHFTTVEKLIKERKGGPTYKIRNAQRNLPIEENVNMEEILSYEVISQGRQINKTISGAMRTQIRQFDILRGTYYETEEYINQSDHGSYAKIDAGIDLNSGDFNSFTQEYPSVSKMTVKDSLRPEMEHNKNIHYQRPFIERMSQQGVRIRIYGNTDMRVGDVVTLEVPEISGVTRKPKPVDIFSNNYIITALKHRCDKNQDNSFTHTMVYELRKPDQYGKPLG